MTTASRVYVDERGVTRVGSVQDLPYIALVCLANGHNWNDPPNIHGQSQFRCDRGCGREKVEVEDMIGVVQKRDYSGGTMLAPEARVLRNEARAELRRRKTAGAQTRQAAADEQADLEMRAAVEGHRAEVAQR